MKHVKTMDVVLVILGVLTVAFIVTMIWIFRTQYAIPDTLVTCYFAAVTGELGAMGWIKTCKEKQQTRLWQLEDEKRYREEQGK